MRWLLFFLIVLNVLTYIWFTFQEDQVVQKGAEIEEKSFDFDSVPSLELLSELPESEVKFRDTRKLIQPKKPVEVKVEKEVVTINADDVLDQLGPSLDVPEVLVEEQYAEERNLFESSMGMCALLGPFPEMVSAKQLKSNLEGKKINAEVVEVIINLPAISWVYIPPQSSRKESLAILKSLQDRNIDSFLISEGEYANGISLGYFSKEESARAVLNERVEQGYDVRLTKRSRERMSYWVAADEKTSPKITDSFYESLYLDNPALKKQEKYCQDIALLKIIE